VLCNCPPGESRSLAQALVREGLAACVNIVPGVTSVFQWQDVLHEDDEHTLVIKAPADRVDALRERIVALHSYTVPEVVVLPVDVHHSHPDYVAWVRGVRPLREVP
jgi:periplasmic divalent cation tolerance protein